MTIPFAFDKARLNTMDDVQRTFKRVEQRWRSLVAQDILGALGDGLHDDTAAFQAAGDQGGWYWLRANRRYVVGSVIFRRPVTFVGEDWTAVWEVKAGTTGIPILIEDVGNNAAINGVNLLNFQLDGNGQGQLDAGLIQSNNNVGGLFDHLWVHSGGAGTTYVNGIAVSAGSVGGVGSQQVIRACLVEGCTKAGINITTESTQVVVDGCWSRNHTSSLDAAPGFQCNGGWNTTFSNCYATGNDGNGFYFATAGTVPPTSPKHAKAVGCYAEGNGTKGVEGDGFSVRNATATQYGRILIGDCHSYGNAAYGFNVQDDQNVAFDNCAAVANEAEGLNLTDCQRVTWRGGMLVDNNQTGNVSGAGVRLEEAVDCTIAHAVIRNEAGTTQKYAIRFATTASDGCDVLYNDLRGNATGTTLRSVVPTNLRMIGNKVGTTNAWRVETEQGALGTLEYAEEEVTLNTGSATTDSSAGLLPANAVIECVTARITTTITTATSWSVGIAGTAARFIPATATMTAGTQVTGLDHWDTALQKQATAAAVRITLNAAPGAGKIRLTVFYRQYTAAAA